MMKRLSLISWLFCYYLCGQNNVATTSGAFLEIGPGARALGMGSAFIITRRSYRLVALEPLVHHLLQ